MLPERISNDLCSLIRKQDRPCLACFMTIDKSGRKSAHKFSPRDYALGSKTFL